MAGTNRKTADTIDDLVTALAAEPHQFGFYQALRLMECLYKEKPRLGVAQRPGDEPVRLSQEPSLSFAPASLTGFTPGREGAPHRLAVRLLGLLGPNGPLPLHYTEYIQQRRRDHGDRTFASFLDMFHHRMLSLFYRAWANNEPVVSYDRPAQDRFGTYVGSLGGLGMATLRKRDEIADQTKFYYCGRLSGHTRCADGLQAVLTDYFDVPVHIEEFVGEWIALPSRHICRLGRDEASGTLGRSAVAGTTVWSCQHKFRIHLGPLSAEAYRRFLPIGDRIGRLVPLVRNYAGDELAWDVRLIMKREEVPSTRLDGTFRLGWTTWLSDRQSPDDAGDLVLDAFAWVVRREETPDVATSGGNGTIMRGNIT